MFVQYTCAKCGFVVTMIPDMTMNCTGTPDEPRHVFTPGE